jgi:hypothetical protein
VTSHGTGSGPTLGMLPALNIGLALDGRKRNCQNPCGSCLRQAILARASLLFPKKPQTSQNSAYRKEPAYSRLRPEVGP